MKLAKHKLVRSTKHNFWCVEKEIDERKIIKKSDRLTREKIKTKIEIKQQFPVEKFKFYFMRNGEINCHGYHITIIAILLRWSSKQNSFFLISLLLAAPHKFIKSLIYYYDYYYYNYKM